MVVSYERGLMKTIVFLFCFGSVLAFAADAWAQSDFSARQGIPMTEAERQRLFLEARRESPVITFGKSDFVIGGPLVAGLRKLPPQENLSRGQKFLRLPIIRLFVPGPMERPSGTGRYFAWKNEDNPLPWPATASRPVAARGATTRVEADSCLVKLQK